LVQIPNMAFSNFFSKKRPSLNFENNNAATKYILQNDTYGYVGVNFNPLELLALYCSAAMHDYEHPGRNNQFMIAINSPLV
jgi:hypothetical protein